MNTVRIPAGTAPTSDKMAKLLAEILAETSLTKESRLMGHWVSFHSERLRSVVGADYSAVAKEAVEAGYIERNDRYAVDRFSKSYRLVKQYRSGDVVDYTLKRCRRTTAKPVGKNIAAFDSVGKSLVECFDHVQLADGFPVPGNKWSKHAVESVLRREWRATRCSFGRFHSSFTSLPKRIRPFLLLNGEPTVELDVSNCQPLLLGELARKWYLEFSHRSGSPVAPHTHHHGTYHHITHATHFCADMNMHQCGVWMDINRFLNDCSEGIVYKKILDAIGPIPTDGLIPARYRRHPNNKPVTIQAIKKSFLVAVFSPVNYMLEMPVFNATQQLYPPVAEYLIATKSGKRVERDGVERQWHQRVAEECQKFESRLMIDTVSANLLPYFPVITIHDSIICPRSHADETETGIRQAYADIGLGVNVKRSKLVSLSE